MKWKHTTSLPDGYQVSRRVEQKHALQAPAEGPVPTYLLSLPARELETLQGVALGTLMQGLGTSDVRGVRINQVVEFRWRRERVHSGTLHWSFLELWPQLLFIFILGRVLEN